MVSVNVVYVTGKSQKVGVGGVTVLTHVEERERVLACTTLAGMGFGLTKDLVDVLVLDYFKGKQIPFTNGCLAGIGGSDL